MCLWPEHSAALSAARRWFGRPPASLVAWRCSRAFAGRYRERVLTVLLTRHGHTDLSDPEHYLGQQAVARLTERGRADARALAQRLRPIPIDRIISSTLARAVETAQILAGERPFESDARLAEMDYGYWDGLPTDEIQRRFPDEYARYDLDPSTHHVGGGESGEQVAERVSAFFADLLDWWARDAGGAERTCLLVGHASVNRVLLAVCLGAPLIDYRRRFQFDWASLTVLRWSSREEGPRMLLANDVAHARGTSGVTWD